MSMKAFNPKNDYLRLHLVTLLLALAFPTKAQPNGSIEVLDVRDSVSFRGLSVPSENIIWVSGSRGTVGRSTDGGKTWHWQQVTGFEQRDFRDIEAFDANTALIMAIAEPAQILKTLDGGLTWQLVFSDSTQGMFLDAMHFRNSKNGIVVGDPVNGNFFLKGTNDGGETWNVDYPTLEAKEGEACFAASGTNIVLGRGGNFQLITGGKTSRFHTLHQSQPLLLVQGKESTGANSISSLGKKLVVVGGDFADDKNTQGNCAVSMNKGKTWTYPSQPPRGYRSCVTWVDQTTLIACGTSGVDISRDDGKSWQGISTDSYHVCQADKRAKVVFLAGSKGKIARLVMGK